ncbi:MAG: hypothetical protein HY209_01180 [Candidatus Omnitrophica bacterium]|nr:hypothetical protein [Candidatus Omnitrophota bacterium]
MKAKNFLFRAVSLSVFFLLNLTYSKADDNTQSNQNYIASGSSIKVTQGGALFNTQIEYFKITGNTINIDRKNDNKGLESKSANSTSGISVVHTSAGTNQSFDLINKTNTARWQKKTFSTAQASKPIVKITQSKELQNLEQHRKARKEALKKMLELRPSRRENTLINNLNTNTNQDDQDNAQP